jgi:hypothetical protein
MMRINIEEPRYFICRDCKEGPCRWKFDLDWIPQLSQEKPLGVGESELYRTFLSAQNLRFISRRLNIKLNCAFSKILENAQARGLIHKSPGSGFTNWYWR